MLSIEEKLTTNFSFLFSFPGERASGTGLFWCVNEQRFIRTNFNIDE